MSSHDRSHIRLMNVDAEKTLGFTFGVRQADVANLCVLGGVLMLVVYRILHIMLSLCKLQFSLAGLI